MQLIQADYVFPVSSPPVKDGILCLQDTGEILELINPALVKEIPEATQIKKYTGLICPGFINCHCHLELSYLKDKIVKGTGITGFIKELLVNRAQASLAEITHAIALAEEEMIQNGIVAVGDIVNTDHTFTQKSLQHLHYHTFIELFDPGEEKADEVFEKGLNLERKLKQIIPSSHTCSIVPHAPYTVSPQLLKRITEHAQATNSLLTIHNQESESENELFEKKTGKLYDFFLDSGINTDYLQQTGHSSLRSLLANLPRNIKILFVHNTFTKKNDLDLASVYSKFLYWCFCAKANLYIENQLPDFANFISQSSYLTLGTDSLASNNKLCILDEIKQIKRHTSVFSFEDCLQWATLNGANFFGIENKYGSLERSKKPGINLITKTNLDGTDITEDSEVKKLF